MLFNISAKYEINYCTHSYKENTYSYKTTFSTILNYKPS